MDVKQILDTISGEEKIALVCGKQNETAAVSLPTLKIQPATQFPYEGEIFPSGLSLACSWDKDAAYGVGREFGLICCEKGIHVTSRVPQMTNIKDPYEGGRWRRLSSDAALSALLAGAYIDGVQSTGVGACAPIGGDGEMAESELQTASGYLCAKRPVCRPKALLFDASALSENEKDSPASYLKERGYSGTAVARNGTAYDAAAALAGGIDLLLSGAKEDPASILKGMLGGKVSGERLNSAAESVLKLIDETYDDHEYPPKDGDVFESAAVRAAQCPVLLKNDGALPLLADAVTVIGDLAASFPISGEEGGERKAESLVSALSGDLRVKFVPFGESEKDIDKVLENTFPEETAIVALGEYYPDLDCLQRTRKLPEMQVKLVQRLCESGRNVIAAVFAGGEVDLSALGEAKAVLFVPYLGEGGAAAVKRILCGEVSPEGRLPEDFRTEDGSKVLYPLGYGLSYGEFVYEKARLTDGGEDSAVSLTLTNSGRYSAAEVVQIYEETFGRRRLVAFEKVRLRAGESRAVTVIFPKTSCEKLLVCASSADAKFEFPCSFDGEKTDDDAPKTPKEEKGISLLSRFGEIAAFGGAKSATKILRAAASAATSDPVRAERLFLAATAQSAERLVRLKVLRRNIAQAALLYAEGKPIKAVLKRLEKEED